MHSFFNSWVILTIITANYFSGRLPISSSFSCFFFFNSVPLCETYFPAISFCLNFSVCDLLSKGCRIIVPLVSGVCLLVDEIFPEACLAFLFGGTGSCPHVGGAGSFQGVCLEVDVSSGQV